MTLVFSNTRIHSYFACLFCALHLGGEGAEAGRVVRGVLCAWQAALWMVWIWCPVFCMFELGACV